MQFSKKHRPIRGEIKYEIFENSWVHVFQIAPENRPLLVNIHEKFIRKKGRQQAILWLTMKYN